MASALTLLTIGKWLTLTSTASAVLIDTRNEYVYSACETTEKKSTLANCRGENGGDDPSGGYEIPAPVRRSVWYDPAP
jgi:hypothetical protein